MLVTTAVAVVGIVTGTFQRLVAVTAFFLALNYALLPRADRAALARAGRARGRSARGVIRGPLRSSLPARSPSSSAPLAGDTINAGGALALLALGFLFRGAPSSPPSKTVFT